MNEELDALIDKYEKKYGFTIAKEDRQYFGVTETVIVEKFDKKGSLVESRTCIDGKEVKK